jgi:Helix-hairpin-helix domain
MPSFARSSSSPSNEVLAGLVERVTFHNDESGFSVLRVKARGQRELITVVGHAAMISPGEFVQASGSWTNDRTHGLQFKAAFLKAAAPTTVEGIEKYLGSGMIRGIGPVYAKKLVRAFGEAVFETIEQQPGRLREVTGIGPKRAGQIIAGWADAAPGTRVRDRSRIRRSGLAHCRHDRATLRRYPGRDRHLPRIVRDLAAGEGVVNRPNPPAHSPSRRGRGIMWCIWAKDEIG